LAASLGVDPSTEPFLSPAARDCSLGAESVDAATSARSMDAATLGSIPFVCTPAGSARRRLIDAGLLARGVASRRVTMEIGSEAPFHAALRDGIGFGILSRRSATDDLTTGRLVELSLPGGPIPAGIDLVWRRDLETTPLRRSFSRELEEELTAAA
jgi:DNA-binding transcriptional LysR family regulator